MGEVRAIDSQSKQSYLEPRRRAPTAHFILLLLLGLSHWCGSQTGVNESSRDGTDRKEAAALLSAGETLLHLPQPNYTRARTYCESALAVAENAAQQHSAAACIALANVSIHDIQHREIDLSLRDIDTQLWRKDFARADALSDALRKQYAGLPIEQDGPNEYITTQLQLRQGQGTNHPVLYPFLKTTGAWIVVAITYVGRALLYILYAFAVVAVIVSVILGIRLRRKEHRSNCIRDNQKAGKTGWRVWNISDEGKMGAAGAIMEALKLGNNVLLRDHYSNNFIAPSLLLSPLPASEQQPTQNTAVWWNFLGGRSKYCAIEKLPITEMKKHSFSFEEALDDIDVKVAGVDVKGVLGAYRSMRRWFYQGYPELQATVGSSGTADDLKSTVRLTCNYKHDWASMVKGNQIHANQSLSSDIQTNTVSVFASTEQQKYADHVGLAAHRAAFKLFYRLAQPNEHPDHIGAVAAFFQGMSLLLLLL